MQLIARQVSASVKVVVALSVFVAATGVTSAQTTGSRPDFSGLWFPSGRRIRTPNPLPFTEAAQPLVDRYAQDFRIEDDPGKYCIWPGMPRAPTHTTRWDSRRAGADRGFARWPGG